MRRSTPATLATPGDPSTGNVNMANAPRSRLKAFLRRLDEASTRRLRRRLGRFRHAECFECGGMDLRERPFMHEAEGACRGTRPRTRLECCEAMVCWTRWIVSMSTVL